MCCISFHEHFSVLWIPTLMLIFDVAKLFFHKILLIINHMMSAMYPRNLSF